MKHPLYTYLCMTKGEQIVCLCVLVLYWIIVGTIKIEGFQRPIQKSDKELITSQPNNWNSISKSPRLGLGI